MSRSSQNPAAPSFGFDRTVLPLRERIGGLARKLWPAKTARHLSSRAAVSERAAEQWLSGTTGLSGDALAELLRSDVGLHVLEEVMADARPGWWPEFKQSVRIEQLERRLAATADEIAQLRADRDR